MADDPFDDVARRLADWAPPPGESVPGFILALRARWGASKHYIRGANDPDGYRIVADRDSTKGRRK